MQNFITDVYEESIEDLKHFISSIVDRQQAIFYLTHSNEMYIFFDCIIIPVYHSMIGKHNKLDIDDITNYCLSSKELIDFFIPDIDVLRQFVFVDDYSIDDKTLIDMFNKRYSLADYMNYIERK